jgi:hypothetical protein
MHFDNQATLQSTLNVAKRETKKSTSGLSVIHGALSLENSKDFPPREGITMNFQAFQDFVGLVSSILGIVAFVATMVISTLRRIQVRSRLTQVIFLGGSLATSTV